MFLYARYSQYQIKFTFMRVIIATYSLIVSDLIFFDKIA